MKEKRISIILNLLIIIMEIISLFLCIKIYGKGLFVFYTIDSNILAMFSSILIVIFSLFRNKIPLFVKILKYISTCMLTVTFLVVIFILVPTSGVDKMLLEWPMPFHHVLCPILSFVSLVFFEKKPKLRKNDSFYGILPTVGYAILFIILNYLYIVNGPYPFLMVYEQPIIMSAIWFIIIIGASYIIAKIIYHFNR